MAYDEKNTEDFLRGVGHNMTIHRKRKSKYVSDDTENENPDPLEEEEESTEVRDRVSSLHNANDAGPSRMPLLLPELPDPEPSLPTQKRKQDTTRKSKRNKN